MNLKLKKINKNYDSDPNFSEAIIRVYGDKLFLEFLLNYRLFNLKEGDKGEIIFTKCLMFRAGDPNDEGFFIDPKDPGRIKNDSIWNIHDFPEIEFGSFYEVENSDWSSITGNGGYINQKMMQGLKDEDRVKLRHFIFFMKEETFECVAENYEEHIPA